MRKAVFIFSVFLCVALSCHAQDIFHRIGDIGTSIFKSFNEVDTNYIRPQEYNWALMMQQTTTIEQYLLQTKSGQEITFAPEERTKVGPYFGWRWIFLGYTFDVSKIKLNDFRDVNISLYSSLVNVDLIWRKSGENYKIKRAKLSNELGQKTFKDIYFPGMETFIRGFNVNYIFNHKKFSYPAAFAQSTCQKRSAGSAIAGISYMDHKLNLDYNSLNTTLTNAVCERYPEMSENWGVDTTLNFKTIRHKTLSLSGGYAYNYVFAKNWLAAGSLSVGVSVKKSVGDIENMHFRFQDFNIDNVNLDGCGRFAVVYNNMKWFVGASTVFYAYTYRKEQFNTANWFGTVNVYLGFNFGKK